MSNSEVNKVDNLLQNLTITLYTDIKGFIRRGKPEKNGKMAIFVTMKC
jgi:hypothetical protein